MGNIFDEMSKEQIVSYMDAFFVYLDRLTEQDRLDREERMRKEEEKRQAQRDLEDTIGRAMGDI